MLNGNLIGVVNSPSTTSAQGLWTMREQYNAKRGNTWPSIKGSVYFDGTGDFLTIPGGTPFSFPGDFTVEFWQKTTATRTYPTFFNTSNGAPTGSLRAVAGDNDNKIILGSGAGGFLVASTAFTTNVWTHIAVVRSGSTVTVYQNGTSVGTASNSTSFTSDTFYIGAYQSDGGAPFQGYISNLRVVKGTAVYTGSFTPSISPLTAISGTQLLTCQSTESVFDASSNNFAVTRYGDAVPSSSSPFS